MDVASFLMTMGFGSYTLKIRKSGGKVKECVVFHILLHHKLNPDPQPPIKIKHCHMNVFHSTRFFLKLKIKYIYC